MDRINIFRAVIIVVYLVNYVCKIIVNVLKTDLESRYRELIDPFLSHGQNG